LAVLITIGLLYEDVSHYAQDCDCSRSMSVLPRLKSAASGVWYASKVKGCWGHSACTNYKVIVDLQRWSCARVYSSRLWSLSKQ